MSLIDIRLLKILVTECLSSYYNNCTDLHDKDLLLKYARAKDLQDAELREKAFNSIVKTIK